MEIQFCYDGDNIRAYREARNSGTIFGASILTLYQSARRVFLRVKAERRISGLKYLLLFFLPPWCTVWKRKPKLESCGYSFPQPVLEGRRLAEGGWEDKSWDLTHPVRERWWLPGPQITVRFSRGQPAEWVFSACGLFQLVLGTKPRWSWSLQLALWGIFVFTSNTACRSLPRTQHCRLRSKRGRDSLSLNELL